MAVRGHGRGRHTSSALDAAVPTEAHVPWSCRAHRVGAYEVGGGWELRYEGARNDGAPLPI